MTVSYIIATQNRSDTLSNVLENIQAVKEENDELIVVNGGKDEEANSVILKYRELIDKYIHEPDINEAHAFNKGILIATCDLVKVFTDDDVLFAEGMLLAKDVFVATPEVMVLQCGGLAVDKGRENAPYSIQKLNASQSVTNPDHSGRLSCGLGLVIRREVFAMIGLFDTSVLAIDNDYIARCIYYDIGIYYADILLYKHIRWEGSAQLNVEQCLCSNIKRFLRYGSFLSVFGESRSLALSCMSDYRYRGNARNMRYWSHWSLHKLYSNWYNMPMYLVTIIAYIAGNIGYYIIETVKECITKFRVYVRRNLDKQKSAKKPISHEWTGYVTRLGGDSKGKFY